ncbi:MAG: ABC transporter permease [Lachnospiraceae bacterium]|nr:ABC transporter permease [Lachnospiraceae bacterium]
MKSKTSLFNVTIFNKNIKRVWPFWGLLSFVAVIPSLLIIMEWIRGEIEIQPNTGAYVKEMYYTAASYVAPFVAFSTAIITAMAVWSYLYSAKSVGAFHSIPVTRTGLFVTSYLSGLAIMLIPYVIGGCLFILSMLIVGCGFSMAVFTLIAAVILDSIFFFSFATVIAMMTGHVLALPLLYFVFNFLSLGLENLFNFVKGSLLFGLSFDLSDNTGFLSPVYYLIRRANIIRDYTTSEYEYGYSRELFEVHFESFHIILIYGAVGVLLAVVALLLYKRKRSESAGDVVSLKSLKPIILTIYTITVTTLLGMLLYYIFSEANINGMSVILGSVCFVAALAISYYTGLMLIEKSVKVFSKKTTRGFIVGAVIVVFCCFALKYDFFGVERRVPKDSEIKEVRVYSGNRFEIDGKDQNLVAKVTNLHRAIIENKEMLQERYYGFDEDCSSAYVSFNYTLKSGEEVTREYTLIIPAKTKNDFDNTFLNFVSDKDIVRTLLHEDDDYYISGGYISFYVHDEEMTKAMGSYDYMDLDEKQAAILYEALKKDLAEGNWRPGISEYVDGYTTIGYMDIAFEQKTAKSRDTYYYNTDDISVNLTSRLTHTYAAFAEMVGVSQEKMDELIKQAEKENEDVETYYYYGK